MKDGGPAFPLHMLTAADGTSYYDAVHKGMSLRDWFAGMALQGMYAWNVCKTEQDTMHYVSAAYSIADAMLKERAK